jgi:hypothetical protein
MSNIEETCRFTFPSLAGTNTRRVIPIFTSEQQRMTLSAMSWTCFNLVLAMAEDRSRNHEALQNRLFKAQRHMRILGSSVDDAVRRLRQDASTALTPSIRYQV